MNQNLLLLFVFAIVIWTCGYMLAALHWFVVPALKTGVLQARGRTYSRAQQPVRFWLGIVFWISMAALMSICVLGLGTQLWRTFLT
jgi:hypothetical protein